MTVPGCTGSLPAWAAQNTAARPSTKVPSTLYVPAQDPMQHHIQKIPLRKGEMVVWDAGQAHGTFPNRSARCRLYQFVRCMKAGEEARRRDPYNPWTVLARFGVSELSRRATGSVEDSLRSQQMAREGKERAVGTLPADSNAGAGRRKERKKKKKGGIKDQRSDEIVGKEEQERWAEACELLRRRRHISPLGLRLLGLEPWAGFEWDEESKQEGQ